MVALYDNKGFTLIEVMISLALVGIVLGGVVGLITSITTYNTKQEMMVSLEQDMRATKHLMTDEIRTAGSNPDNNIRIGFLKDGDEKYDTDANSIHFLRDIDNDDLDQYFEPDGDANDPDEDISYYRIDEGGNLIDVGVNTPGILVRDDGGGPVPVMDNVTELEFIYYDDDDNDITGVLNGNPMTADLDDIRKVEVVITGQVLNPDRVNEPTQTSRFRITVRNAGI